MFVVVVAAAVVAVADFVVDADVDHRLYFESGWEVSNLKAFPMSTWSKSVTWCSTGWPVT